MSQSFHSLMKPGRSSLGPLLVLALGTIAPQAMAQADPSLDPAAGNREPNVLLIVDSSGSMEYRTGMAVDAEGKRLEPTCNPSMDNSSQKSRWIELVEVLGGTIGNYRCETVSRRDPSFALEFQLDSGVPPSDVDYRTAYHRPMSGDCEVRPGVTSTTNVFEFNPPWFRNRNTDADCASSFVQGGDGLIDSFTSLVRFGLMTFDPLPDPGIGYLPSYQKDWATGTQGAFSYFVGTKSTGRPVYCPQDKDIEVGVRNGAAPAWEGKMIAFGDPEAGSQSTLHSQIKNVLLSTRPFGASPLAGALSDAMTFLWLDDQNDPIATTRKYSPKHDRYVKGGCREQHIILFTDGEPNLDFRPSCAAQDPANVLNGQCPFKQPVEIVQGLKAGSFQEAKTNTTITGKPAITHVVGFVNPTTQKGADCKAITDNDITSPTGICATNNGADKELDICCRLHEMAYYGRKAGSSNLAFFGNDQATLRTALGNILGEIVRKTASATRPVRAPGVGAAEDPAVKALRLLTSYSSSGGLWHGNVERMRWTCPAGEPVEQPKSEAAGDDFNHNISKDVSSLNSRQFITFIESTGKSDRTIRPNMGSTNDGLGNLTGTQEFATGDAIAGDIPFDAIAGGATVPSSIPACADLPPSGTGDCRDRIIKWVLGYAPDHNGQNHRCASPGSNSCSVIGDVLHSTPTIVNRPSAVVSDETYDKFIERYNKRPMMAYVSSNDGQLHGFIMSRNDATSIPATPDAPNEQFSFIPPAVLPSLPSEYPGTRLKLMDGVAVVQDVVATQTTGGPAGAYEFRLERGIADSQASNNFWRTILVQGFGEAGSGYYALDITDVEPHATTGPRFLWQITKDSAGAPIFGKGGVPLITTLNMNDGGVNKEVAVAILPGGDAPHTAGACNRAASGWPHIPTDYEPRSKTRCYANDEVARSITIVRLDSGQIIRTFRRTAGAAGAIPTSLVRSGANAPIHAPVSGIPTAYPAGTGAVADRVFVGDRDGSLYRLDVSNATPDNWTLQLFFDALSKHPQKGSSPDEISQPLMTRPTLSIDARDQITIAFATGMQDLSATTKNQYVWSLTEAVNTVDGRFDAKVNWYKVFEGTGEHVLGPLELFGGVLYFSTYTPPPTSDEGALACQAGAGAIYGLDYLIPADVSDPSKGGLPALKTGATAVEKRTAAELGLDSNAVIFGVAVEFAPSCYDISDAAGALAMGSRARVSGASMPQMKLSFQTNSTTTAGPTNNFQTTFQSINLAPPKIASNIESWASILE